MNKVENLKEKKKVILEKGFHRYGEKEYPSEEGKMIALITTSCDAPWMEIEFSKENWTYYKKSTDIIDRSFYWKPAISKD